MVEAIDDKSTSKWNLSLSSGVAHVKGLAQAFAMGVTEEVPKNSAWIAKKGSESLFRALKRMIPQVSQPECKGRRFRFKGKITCPEFNKLLQKNCGFICSRTRKKSLTSSAGNWLFSNRRWLNPTIITDKNKLLENYEIICREFPHFSSCSRANFIDVLTEVVCSWDKTLSAGDKKMDSLQLASLTAQLDSNQSGSSGQRFIRLSLAGPTAAVSARDTGAKRNPQNRVSKKSASHSRTSETPTQPAGPVDLALKALVAAAAAVSAADRAQALATHFSLQGSGDYDGDEAAPICATTASALPLGEPLPFKTCKAATAINNGAVRRDSESADRSAAVGGLAALAAALPPASWGPGGGGKGGWISGEGASERRGKEWRGKKRPCEGIAMEAGGGGPAQLLAHSAPTSDPPVPAFAAVLLPPPRQAGGLPEPAAGLAWGGGSRAVLPTLRPPDYGGADRLGWLAESAGRAVAVAGYPAAKEVESAAPGRAGQAAGDREPSKGGVNEAVEGAAGEGRVAAVADLLNP